MLIAVLDTGVANVASMTAAFSRLRKPTKICRSGDDVSEDVTHVVLPGVGAFGAVEALRERGFDHTVTRVIDDGTPLLAVCLGLQMLCEASEERPDLTGLGVIPGRCCALPPEVVVPHLGWNEVIPSASGVVERGYAAFANSYGLLEPPDGWKVSWTLHGTEFVAALERDNVLACQFHPELSSSYGLDLIRRWLDVSGRTEGTGELSREKDEDQGGLGAIGVVADRVAEISAIGVEGLERSGAAIRGIPDVRVVDAGPQVRTLLTSRIIPCLDVQHGRVVKGIRFQDLRDVGDPAECAARYEMEGADEIVVLDIAAAPDEARHRTDVVRSVREAVGIPLTVGGGVRTVEDARTLLSAGADKVSVNTAAVRRPELIEQMADQFGCQCVVVAIDAKREGDSWSVRTVGGRETTSLNVVDWAVHAVTLGAGEILLTSWDRDGTRAGYDIELIEAVTSRVRVPVIASGGGGSANDLLHAFQAGAHAVLAASIFHDRDMSVRELKDELRERQVRIRL